MMKYLLPFTVLLLHLHVSHAAFEVKGDTYMKKSAIEKSALIWKNVQENSSPADWFSTIRLLGIFAEGMCPSFTAPGDELPYTNWIMGYRKKYIHTVGAIGKVNWVSKGKHPYTGLFKGATHGYVRLSLAAAPEKSPPQTAPGLAVKFLRDGIDSGNFVAMFGVDGQKSWNFFKNDFWNHIAPPASSLLMKLGAKFATATNNIQQVGLSDFAKYGNDGKEEKVVTFPYKLRFHRPGGDKEYQDEYHGDFLDDLRKVETGVLYQVWAMDKPKELGGTESHIADLELTSKLQTSKWGDEKMFFRHQDMGADLVIHPEWNQYTAAYRKVDKPNVVCPFH
jgi:hypothetical protein